MAQSMVESAILESTMQRVSEKEVDLQVPTLLREPNEQEYRGISYLLPYLAVVLVDIADCLLR